MRKKCIQIRRDRWTGAFAKPLCVPPCKHVSVKSTSLTDEQGKGLKEKVNEDRNNEKGRCQNICIRKKDLNSDLNKMADQGE